MRTDRLAHRRPTAPLAGLVAGLIAAASLTAGPALAQNRTMCSQPVKPTCIESDLTYDDPQRIDRCERDLENYASSVEDYLSCLEQKMTEQRQTLEELEHEFRCNANDDVEC